MSGHEKVQCNALKLKHSKAKFRKQGGGGGRIMKFAAFFFFKNDCFMTFLEELGTLT